jgi:hypothetical protein
MNPDWKDLFFELGGFLPSQEWQDKYPFIVKSIAEVAQIDGVYPPKAGLRVIPAGSGFLCLCVLCGKGFWF